MKYWPEIRFAVKHDIESVRHAMIGDTLFGPGRQYHVAVRLSDFNTHAEAKAAIRRALSDKLDELNQYRI